MKQKTSGQIHWWQVVAAAAAGAAVILLIIWIVFVRESLLMVLTPFLIALILSYLLAPLVHYMGSRGISRTVAITAIYLVFAIIIFIFCVRVMPLILDDLQELVERLPEYAAGLQEFLNELAEDFQRFNMPAIVREIVDNNIEGIGAALTAQLERSHHFLLDLFGRILLLLLVPVLTFYFLRDEAQLKEWFLNIFPAKARKRVADAAADIDTAIGSFIRGALLVSVAVGAITYIGLLILQVKFPLVLAIIVGITNLIPYIGPIIGALPAVLVAFLEAPLLAFKVAALIFIIQQVESSLIVPVVIGRSTRLHPLSIILVLLVGGKLFGFAGLILAVPVTIILRIIFTHALSAWRNAG